MVRHAELGRDGPVGGSADGDDGAKGGETAMRRADDGGNADALEGKVEQLAAGDLANTGKDVLGREDRMRRAELAGKVEATLLHVDEDEVLRRCEVRGHGRGKTNATGAEDGDAGAGRRLAHIAVRARSESRA